ncbi:uncharacterized protein LOC103524116 [Trichonephila clavipes]|nr:uncharacterized protein LOC103524116 [Trichonephila clavipes]
MIHQVVKTFLNSSSAKTFLKVQFLALHFTLFVSWLMPPVRCSQIEAHEIHHSKGLEVRLSLALSTIQVIVRISLAKFPGGTIDGATTYLHLHNLRYPDEDRLHVLTDGSATAPFGRAGVSASSNSFNLKEPLSAWLDNFDGEIYAIFMAFTAISTTPGLNIVIFIDSQAAIKTISGYNLFPSKLEFECKQLINSFLCTGREWLFSNGSHLIAVFMETNKLAKEASMLHPPCHPMPLRNAKRLLRDKLRQKRISTLTDLAVGKPWSCLFDS